MTAISGDMSNWPALSAKRDRVVLAAEQAIGAAGAVGVLVSDDPGVVVTKNAAAGTYDIVFPKAIRGSLRATIVSPLGTIKGSWMTAFNAAAGTAQLVTGNAAGAATNPADGDIVQLLFLLDTRSDA
jgi:hypothetical protein